MNLERKLDHPSSEMRDSLSPEGIGPAASDGRPQGFLQWRGTGTPSPGEARKEGESSSKERILQELEVLKRALTTGDVAEMLDISPNLVSTYFKEGRIPGIKKTGGDWLTTPEAAEEFAKKPRPPGRPPSE